MTPNLETDRRQYKRYRVNIYTQIVTPEFYISLNTIEVSIEGIRVESYSEIPPGTEVTVSFDLEKKLDFFGKVIWVIAFQEKGIIKFRIGVKIHEVMLSGIKVIGFDFKHELIQGILTKLKKKQV